MVPRVGKCQLVSIVHEPPSPPLPIIAGVVFGVIPQQSLLSDVPIFAAGDKSGTSLTLPKEAVQPIMANIATPQESGSLVNLWLPQAVQGGAGKTQKVWVGDGFPPIPKKVHERIIAWEYVDLGDLRQAGTWETLNPEPDPQQVVILQGIEVARAKRRPIKDIYTWIQCFAIYMAAMAKHDPGSIPEMLAFMLTIMKAQKEFKKPAWRLYDVAYREKAAATGNKKWSQIDPFLYNQLFTGRANEIAFCQHCHSTTHTSDTCKEAPPRKRPAIAGNNSQHRGWDPPHPRPSGPVCWQYNQGHCSFQPNCRFRHVCSACKRPHPLVYCPRASRGGPQTSGPTAQKGEKAKDTRANI